MPGYDEPAFIQAHHSGPSLSIRINPSKFNSSFTDQLPVDGKVPWCDQGYYLHERPSFTLDPLFHAGAYYVQEPSSMFLSHALHSLCDLSVPLRVLDLCASPGGKSTLLQSTISPESLLVSNEVIRGRVGVLCDNLTRWGAANVVVTQNDARDFASLEDFFDILVVDAPCSGSGLYRKEPDAIDEWSPQQVLHCAARQKRILADAMPSLAPGGLLIYSTCSFSSDENEKISQWLCEEWQLESQPIHCDASWNITETTDEGIYGYRFYPHLLKGEGFFMAAFRKPLQGEKKESKSKKLMPADPLYRKAASLYCQTDWLYPSMDAGFFSILPPAVSSCLDLLKKSLHISKAGVRAGEWIRDEWIPDHELALSSFLSSDVRKIELEKPAALDYLRRQSVEVPLQEKGWAVVCFSGLALGWVKVLASRLNNYYPKNWRILNK
jgi:16S rRNA C967 or C1407 C5-methylase (RsmB/RsmF family)